MRQVPYAFLCVRADAPLRTRASRGRVNIFCIVKRWCCFDLQQLYRIENVFKLSNAGEEASQTQQQFKHQHEGERVPESSFIKTTVLQKYFFYKVALL